jgi:hypothetical protein
MFCHFGIHRAGQQELKKPGGDLVGAVDYWDFWTTRRLQTTRSFLPSC